MVKWGFIGLGKIAHEFAMDLQLVDGAELTAVASRDYKKAELFAFKYNAKTAYGSYQEILKDGEVDILYIATPHNSHFQLAMAAMNAGKHVLCEKPLAVNGSEVKQMIRCSEKNGVFLMEAFWSQFNPSIVEVLRQIKSGIIGKVRSVHADFSFITEAPDSSRLINPDLAGGALLDIGVYPLFLAYSILGIPDQIVASSRFHSSGIDLQTSAILKYKEGMANVACDFTSNSDMKARIYGTKGNIIIDPIWHQADGFSTIIDDLNKHYSFPRRGKGYTHEIEKCMRCITEGRTESALWTHQNSLDLISICDKIREQIKLKYPFEA